MSKFVPVLLLLALPATARESWLAASDWEPRPGEEVRLARHEGAGFQGDPLAQRRARVTRLLIRGASEDDRRDGADLPSSLPWDDGGLLVATEGEASVARLEGWQVDELVRDAGLRGVAAMRGDRGHPARVQRVDCDKLWISGSDSRRVRRPAGHALELVPRRDPSHVGTLRLQLLHRGRPVTGALVQSWMQPFDDAGDPVPAASRLGLPARQVALTDRLGRVRLDVAAHGEWLVSTMHAVPSRNPHVADWDAFTASLAFARGAERLRFRSSEPRRLRGTGLGTNPDLGDPFFERPTTLRDVPGWGRQRRN